MMKKFKRNKKNIILLLIILAIIFFLSFYFLIPSFFILPEISTYGFTQATVIVDTESGILKLATVCYELEMVIGKEQAASIENGMNNVISYRPNTHDILKEMLESFDIEVLMMKITKMEDSTYYARLILKKGNSVLDLDCRPSDAVALAVRTNSPIYVNDSLLEMFGEKIC